MRKSKLLTGPFTRVNDAALRDKAGRDDPRAPFYKAMLAASTYEEYYAIAGDGSVEVATYRAGPVTPQMEILYARRNRWIEDG